jgi:uncharacterized membrane-anchored protein
MRFIDFIVFYVANFRKNLDESTRKSQLGQAVFIASLNTSLIICILVEVICFLFKVDIASSSDFFLKFAIGGILMYALFEYIYMYKKRYEYIVSAHYKPFRLDLKLGISICFALFFVLLIAMIIVPGTISTLLTK